MGHCYVHFAFLFTLNAVQYRSVPFNTIEDIRGKFVGLNGTLNGKK